MAKRIKIASGIAATANILDDDVVSMASKPNWVGVDNRGCNAASIRLAHQQCRLGAGLRRIVVI
jgi:hypothetical protein